MPDAPKRIQRSRQRGWRTPLCSCGCGKNARYVGRPTKFGNPAVVGQHINIWIAGERRNLFVSTHRFATEVFEALLTEPDVHLDWWSLPTGWEDELRGHDLSCWCHEDATCHADLLLGFANA